MIPITDFGDVGRGNDDYDAIMAAFNKCASYGGGNVVTHGGLHTRATIKPQQGCNLIGEGWHSTALKSYQDADISVLHMLSDTKLSDISIFGNQTSDARADSVVRVMTGAVGGVVRDVRIWGGEWGLATSGVDFKFDNVFVQGTGRNGGNVVSNGGSWWDRLKCDSPGHVNRYGFWQQWNGSSMVAENHFVNGDFSGNFDVSVASDGYSNVMGFTNTVFSRPQHLNSGYGFGYANCRFGADIIIASGVPCAIGGGSLGYGAGINASGAKVSAGTIGIYT